MLSMLLHEVYFDSLGEAGGGDRRARLPNVIARDFGPLAKMARRIRCHGQGAGRRLGLGRADALAARRPLVNVWAADHTHSLAGGTPVLALDMYEHSYHIDFGSNAAAYVDAFMANIAWSRIDARFAGLARRVAYGRCADGARHARRRSDLVVIDARLADDAATVPVRLRGARRAPPDRSTK